MLTVGHGNGHNRPELVEYARRTADGPHGWASFGGNETQHLTDDLAKLGRITVAAGFAADRVRSTCIVTSRDHEQLGETSLRISDAMPTISGKLHPDRALAASFYRHPIADALGARGVAHINAHPPPTVMHHERGHPVVDAYRNALFVVRSVTLAARMAGYLIVITGDLQATRRFAEPWSPIALLANPLNLRCRVTHIDWIMADAELQFAGPLNRHKLFDHEGFTASMVPA